ncbi:protein mono-ADP-ribosyltransferase PARP9-like [Lithobates pipiens]
MDRRVESYMDRCVESYMDRCVESYMDRCLESYMDRRLESYMDRCLESYMDRCLESYMDRCLESYMDRCLESYMDRCLESYMDRCLESYMDRCVESYMDRCVESYMDRCVESYMDRCVESYMDRCVESYMDRRLESYMDRCVESYMDRFWTTIIVNSLGADLKVNAGQVSRAILAKAGPKLQQEVTSKAKFLNPLPIMIPTAGYNLSCWGVYHVILDINYGISRLDVLKQAITQCLFTAYNYASPSISFPALGTGTIGLSKKDVAEVMMNTVLTFAVENPCSMDVYFVIYPQDTETYKAFRDRWKTYEWNKNTTSATKQRDPTPDIGDASSNSRDSKIPCLIINAESDEDAEEAKAWLENVLYTHPISIHNNLVLLLGQEEHDILSSSDFPDVFIEEKLSNGKCLLEIDGPQQEKIKGVIKVEQLLLNVQEKHAVTLEEELVEAAVVWFYENAGGAWRYPAKANREIEKAFVTQSDLTLNSEPHHTICMKSPTAKGRDGSFWLERRPLFTSSKAGQKKHSPIDWPSSVVLVDPKSQEFQDYVKKFKKDRLTLVKMECIHNRYLSKIFQSKKETNKKTVQLYQAVPRQFTRLICDVGFQSIFSNPIDPKFGQGIYFADSARRAVDFFQTPKEESGLIYIFQAEVLADNPTEGGKDLPVLVPIPRKKSSAPQSQPNDILDLCDSLVNSTFKPSIYAIADNFRANPQYLFTFQQ